MWCADVVSYYIVAYNMVCVLGMTVSYAKMAELIEMLFGMYTCKPKKQYVRWGSRSPWMCQFFVKYKSGCY